MAFKENTRELVGEGEGVFVLDFAIVGRVGALHPRVAVSESGCKPSEEEVAQFAVVYKIEIGGIGDNGIDGGVRYGELRAIAVEDHRGVFLFEEFFP